MPRSPHPALFTLIFVFVMLANALWYCVKMRLRREGKDVSWFGDHLRDYRLLREVIAETESGETRQTFRRLLIAMYCLPAAVLISFALMVASVFFRSAGVEGP